MQVLNSQRRWSSSFIFYQNISGLIALQSSLTSFTCQYGKKNVWGSNNYHWRYVIWDSQWPCCWGLLSLCWERDLFLLINTVVARLLLGCSLFFRRELPYGRTSGLKGGIIWHVCSKYLIIIALLPRAPCRSCDCASPSLSIQTCVYIRHVGNSKGHVISDSYFIHWRDLKTRCAQLCGGCCRLSAVLKEKLQSPG